MEPADSIAHARDSYTQPENALEDPPNTRWDLGPTRKKARAGTTRDGKLVLRMGNAPLGRTLSPGTNTVRFLYVLPRMSVKATEVDVFGRVFALRDHMK